MTDHLTADERDLIRAADDNPQRISDHILDLIARDYAQEIVADLDPDDHDPESSIDDAAHETADSSQWVIYTFRAKCIALLCDVTEGEAFLADVGTPDDPTLDNIATAVAYGELRARIAREAWAMWRDRTRPHGGRRSCRPPPFRERGLHHD